LHDHHQHTSGEEAEGEPVAVSFPEQAVAKEEEEAKAESDIESGNVETAKDSQSEKDESAVSSVEGQEAESS
jgi:hypothetical protein